jgi:hypothetical protein
VKDDRAIEPRDKSVESDENLDIGGVVAAVRDKDLTGSRVCKRCRRTGPFVLVPTGRPGRSRQRRKSSNDPRQFHSEEKKRKRKKKKKKQGFF